MSVYLLPAHIDVGRRRKFLYAIENYWTGKRLHTILTKPKNHTTLYFLAYLHVQIDFCSYLFLVFNTYSGQPQSL